MIIKFVNVENKIQTKFVNEESDPFDFDYVTFINKLYDGEEIELQFEGVEDEDKEKLESFIDKIRQINKSQGQIR